MRKFFILVGQSTHYVKYSLFKDQVYIYKVTAIKVGHTCFLPILANRAVNFGAIFMKISMYVYFGYTKNGSNFFRKFALF